MPAKTSDNLNLKPNICYFGVVHDGAEKTFGILQEDRRKHMYILGKTGMGKTTLLENMILQDIYNGNGVCFIDPHGDPSEYILSRIPAHRQNDVVYINPADTDYPIGLNILEPSTGEEPFLIASGLMAVFNKIWSGLWSARMEYILNNTLLALLETPGNTILGVIKMLTDDNFRDKIVSQVSDPLVRNFWLREFANFNLKYRQEAISPILNKVGQFLSSEPMRNILGQTHSKINFREIMDSKKILIVNLSKGKLGEDNSNLFGSLIVAKLQIAALSRVDIPEEKRKDFFVYVDEFQNFTTDSFATILSEARKYRLNLILAHQYISQLTESGSQKIKNAIFGNVGTIITFRLGSQDAIEIARELGSTISSQTLISLERTQIALKISIEGKVSEAFIANSIPPIFEKLDGNANQIIAISRQRYTVSKELISKEINDWFGDDSGKLSVVSKKKKKSAPLPETQPEPKKTVANSENVLEIKLPLKTNSRMSLKDRLSFSKKLQNSSKVVSDKLDKFDKSKENEEYFELPG
ncbi:MAG: type IV secretion system DNA-binding domain-containing protein [bacterium]